MRQWSYRRRKISQASQRIFIARKYGVQPFFWKFDKSYALRDQNKYRNDSDSSINEVNRTDQISHIKQELHNDNCSHARLSLKDEVSILLKALVISKKNRKYSDASSPFSSDYQTKLRDKDGGVNEIDITMRQIEPYEVINIS